MKKTINLLEENSNLFKILTFIALPAVIEQTLLTMVNYIGTAMVGSLGNNATSSIGIVNSTIWLINGIFAAVAIGFYVPVGRYLGAGQTQRAKEIVKQSMIGLVLVGLFITSVVQIIAQFLPVWLKADPAIHNDATMYLRITSAAYVFTMASNVCSGILRVSGDTRTPLFLNFAANFLNIIVGFFTIYPTREITLFKKITFQMWGMGLGVRGAAVAAAASVVFSGVTLFFAVMKNQNTSFTLKGRLRIDPTVWKDMVIIGSPVAADRVANSFGQIIMTSMVTKLGITAITANTLAVTAEAITYMPAFGLSVAATTLVAQTLGAAKKNLAQRYAKACVISSLVFMFIMGFVLYFSAEALMSIFSKDPEVIKLGATVLKIEALAQPASGMQTVTTGIMRGAKDTKWAFIVSVAGMWCVRIPLASLLLKFTDLGLICAWIAMAADLTVRGLISYLVYKKTRWQDRILVQENATAKPA